MKAISSFSLKVNRLNLHFFRQKSRNAETRLKKFFPSTIFYLSEEVSLVAKVATKFELLVAKLKVLVALATVSVAISSPDWGV